MKIVSKLQYFAAFLLLFLSALWLLQIVSQTLFFSFVGLIPSFYLLIGLSWFAVHLLFALGIANDAKRLNANSQSSGAFFVEPLAWGLATLVGGLFVVVMYWIFHYPILRR